MVCGGRTKACIGALIECIREAVFALRLERVRLQGGLLWGSVAPVIYQICCARTGRACCRSWPRHDNGCPWEATSGDLMPEVSYGGRLWCSISIELFSGWKVDEGCQCIECCFTLGVHPGVFCLESSHGDDHGFAGGCEVMYPINTKAHEGLHNTCDEVGEVAGGVELTKLDTDQLTGPHAIVEL
eukprot:1149120-Pelagomonas_calceolata.AAC.1